MIDDDNKPPKGRPYLRDATVTFPLVMGLYGYLLSLSLLGAKLLGREDLYDVAGLFSLFVLAVLATRFRYRLRQPAIGLWVAAVIGYFMIGYVAWSGVFRD